MLYDCVSGVMDVGLDPKPVNTLTRNLKLCYLISLCIIS